METTALREAGVIGTKLERRSQFRLAVGRFASRRLAVAGCVLIALIAVIAVLAPVISPYGPDTSSFSDVLKPPSLAHVLGTDDLGRDILSRVIYGSQISLAVSTVSVALAVVVGVALGIVSGYAGGMIDEAFMRVLDSFMALPSLVLALTIASVLGAGVQNATVAIAVAAVPTYARLIRGQALSVKQNDYVLAERAVGASSLRVVIRHILPNTMNPIIVQASLGVGYAIITESSLSFLGLGAQPPTPSWGSMIEVGFQFLQSDPWFVLAPAVMIFLAVLGFNLLGDGIRDALDPTMRNV